jgi:hypothetical protein
MKKYFFVIIFISLLITYSCTCDDIDEGQNNEYPIHFIAHAGGQIDGHIYTNSLEAMNLSYSKGCKLFELDLVYTTDNKIVAQHGYPNITEAEFMQQLIDEKYTPMNMDAINAWFKNNSDAILVTDKINDPQRICDEFNFKDRVIMELFSWEAVDKAIELGITPLVSENLIFGTDSIESVLEHKNIKYIGMSRNSISGNEQFLEKLKNKGIQNYVWSLEADINGSPAEYYVWNYEMYYCFGMYANNLDLLYNLMNNSGL